MTADVLRSLLLAALLVGCDTQQPEAPKDAREDRVSPVLTGRLENRSIDEASGLARSQRQADVYWVVNDSGKPRLHPIDGRGKALGRVKVDDAKLSDWEDIASFTLNGTAYLLIADIGDNDRTRKDVRLYVVEEPEPGDAEVDVAWEFEYTYPGGPKDAEAVAVDVDNERVLVLSKRQVPPVLYALPLQPDGDGVQQASRLGVPALPMPRRQEIEFAPRTKNWWWQPTGIDLAQDGSAAVILTYRGVYYYPRRPDEDWLSALQRKPVALSVGDYGDAESVAFSMDGSSIFVTLEGRGAPLIRIDLNRTRSP